MANSRIHRSRPCPAYLNIFRPIALAIVFLVAPSGTLHASVPPSDIMLNSTSVRQHEPAGTIVGILRTSDSDLNDTHSYALVAGTGSDDNALFDINADTLRTLTILEHTNQNRFSIRIETRDAEGGTFEKPFTITVTPPPFVDAFLGYFAANLAVSNASLAYFDKETLDYFWVYQNSLAATGAIAVDRPANTPPDTATNGTASVYLTTIEATRILAAKTAHAIWLDKNAMVSWRLRDYAGAHLRSLFDKATVFNRQSSSVYYYLSVVDHSPTDAYRYALQHGLIKETKLQTLYAVLDDFRSDFLHGSRSYGDPSCAYTLGRVLADYSTSRWRPARITRSGCHSMSRVLLGVLRSLNIPGYETTTGEYFLAGHSEAVLPCVERVLPHGDHIYSSDLSATPAEELMPTFQFFVDNAYTPPCAGEPYRVALRYQALRGTAYPTPTILRGVRDPALYGYTNATAFLAGYAGWDRGLTQLELEQAAVTLLTQYNETRRLTVPTETTQGYVINNPSASDYVRDSRVLLKALPKAGHNFGGWTGDVPAGQETANPLVLTMDTEKNIQANFSMAPLIVTLVKAVAGEAQIIFTAQAGVSYTVQYRDHLDSGSWQDLAVLAPQSTATVVTNSDLAPPTQRFYQVVAQ